MTKEELRFIDRLYKELYKSKEVIHHGTGNVNNKFENIEMYINALERVHEKATKNDRYIKYLKELYYDKYVIKREDIPESYYEMQKNMYLERGYGHVELTEKKKKEIQDIVINDQKSRIDTWLDYLISPDAQFYPSWAKYWAFQGMLKIGKFDKEKQRFYTRSEKTVDIFVDLNSEALSLSIDAIKKYINKEKIEDEDLESIVKNGSFQGIYPYILLKLLSNNDKIVKRNEGKWIKYLQGSDSKILADSLCGYNTGWCTAGYDTAENQLKSGDFYVYYTLDENDEYKVPRIAIRMMGNKIGEVRGIASHQNIESDMESVVEEKLQEFPDKDEYLKKVNDMKILTTIYKKHKNNEVITKEELAFLYEINSKILGFGYQKDPRINEIIKERGKKREDVAYALNCELDRVAVNSDEINNDTLCFVGDLDLSHITNAKDIVLPKYITGDLALNGLTSAEGLKLPENIGGSLWLNGLTSAEGLVFPENIGGDLDLRYITNAKDIVLPKYITGYLALNGLTSAEGLKLPENIGGSLDLSSLTSAEGLVFPENIGGYLDLRHITNAIDIVLPKYIHKHLVLDSLTSADGLVLPENIGEDVFLRGLENLNGVELPNNFDYNIHIKGGVLVNKYNIDDYRNSRKIA